MPTKSASAKASQPEDLLVEAKRLLTEIGQEEYSAETAFKISLANMYLFAEIAESLRAIVQQHQEG